MSPWRILIIFYDLSSPRSKGFFFFAEFQSQSFDAQLGQSSPTSFLSGKF